MYICDHMNPISLVTPRVGGAVYESARAESWLKPNAYKRGKRFNSPPHIHPPIHY